MKYYEIGYCENAVKNPMICFSNLEAIGLSESTFINCERFADTSSKIQFYVRDKEDEGTPDDGLQNVDMLPVFSPRLVKALQDSEIQGIQYVPVDVVRYDKTELQGFCIANVTTYVENALNIEKSFLMKDEFHRRKYSFIWTYAIEANKINNLDVFRLKLTDKFTKKFSTDIIVSEKFKKIFQSHKFTGYMFKQVIMV